jgi:hypothetical protein
LFSSYIGRGQITLDDAVSSILPELKEPEILIGFKEGSGEPTYEKAKAPITLRYIPTILIPWGEMW